VDETLRLSRTDMALLRKAARERWGVPDPVKTEAIFQTAKILADPLSSDRDRIAAARTMALLDRIDQADDRLNRQYPGTADVPDAAAIMKAMREAAERYEQRPGDEGSDRGGAEPVPDGPDPVQ
jgi:hypothetical protein